jgi:hypothetical protein
VHDQGTAHEFGGDAASDEHYVAHVRSSSLTGSAMAGGNESMAAPSANPTVAVFRMSER